MVYFSGRCVKRSKSSCISYLGKESVDLYQMCKKLKNETVILIEDMLEVVVDDEDVAFKNEQGPLVEESEGGGGKSEESKR